MAEQQNQTTRNRVAAQKMLAVETGITAAIAILLYAAVGAVAARSAVLGGLIFILPNALFVGYAFRSPAGQSAAAALRGLYIGEAVKLFATAVMFAAGFIFVKPLNVGVLFGVFLALLVINVAGNAYLMK